MKTQENKKYYVLKQETIDKVKKVFPEEADDFLFATQIKFNFLDESWSTIKKEHNGITTELEISRHSDCIEVRGKPDFRNINYVPISIWERMISLMLNQKFELLLFIFMIAMSMFNIVDLAMRR